MFFGAVVIARPEIVVDHADGVLASYLPIGTRYFGVLPKSRETAYEELATGDLQWGERTWADHNMLTLVRPGDAYSIMGFWNAADVFVGWYCNLQDPLQWTDFGYDTRDHALDVIFGEDLASFMWKDEHELEMSVTMGLYTEDEARAIRKTGEDVIDMVMSGNAWWKTWRDFTPDPSWPTPSLPDGWDLVSPSS